MKFSLFVHMIAIWKMVHDPFLGVSVSLAQCRMGLGTCLMRVISSYAKEKNSNRL